jgi:hypothetical protein
MLDRLVVALALRTEAAVFQKQVLTYSCSNPLEMKKKEL